MIQRKILSNGMVVVFKSRKNGVVSMAFAVRHGGINEVAEDKGISHFIEHMLFKGTINRSRKQITEEIERNGGQLNGFTSEQMTAFWCKMPSRHVDVGLGVLGDMVKNPIFKDADMERQVIFEEIKMYHDTPQLYVFDKIKNLLYKGDFAVPLIGTKESMEGNSVEKMKEWFERIYVPENMMLCVVGDADFEKICDFAEKNFVKGSGRIDKTEVILNNEQIVEKRRGIDQANLVFGYHSPLPNDEKYYAAEVLSTLMGRGMSSRLFNEIRENRNLAYAVKSDIDSEKDYSYTWVYVGTTADKVEEVKKLIVEEFEKVANDLGEEELGQVKEQIIGNYLIEQEDSVNVLRNLLFEEIKGDAEDEEKFVENIRNVKLEDVKELAKLKDYSFFALVPE